MLKTTGKRSLQTILETFAKSKGLVLERARSGMLVMGEFDWVHRVCSSGVNHDED